MSERPKVPASKAGVARATEGSNPSVTARWPRSPERSGLRGFVVVGGPARIRNLSSGDLARNSHRGDGLLESMMCSEPPQLHTSMGMHVGTGTRCRDAGHTCGSTTCEHSGGITDGCLPRQHPRWRSLCPRTGGDLCLLSGSRFPVPVQLLQFPRVSDWIAGADVPRDGSMPARSSREHLMAKSASATRARGAGWGTIPS